MRRHSDGVRRASAAALGTLLAGTISLFGGGVASAATRALTPNPISPASTLTPKGDTTPSGNAERLVAEIYKGLRSDLDRFERSLLAFDEEGGLYDHVTDLLESL